MEAKCDANKINQYEKVTEMSLNNLIRIKWKLFVRFKWYHDTRCRSHPVIGSVMVLSSSLGSWHYHYWFVPGRVSLANTRPYSLFPLNPIPLFGRFCLFYECLCLFVSALIGLAAALHVDMIIMNFIFIAGNTPKVSERITRRLRHWAMRLQICTVGRSKICSSGNDDDEALVLTLRL